MSLEELEKKLYQPDAKPAPGKDLFAKKPGSEERPSLEPWHKLESEEKLEDIKEEIQERKFFKKFSGIGRWVFVAAIAGALILIGFTVFYIKQYFSSRDLVLTVNAPDNVLIGAPFNLKINFSNDSDETLRQARLSVVLPEGAVFKGEPLDKRVLIRELGNLEKDATFFEEVPAVVLENEQSNKRFSVILSYQPSSIAPRLEVASDAQASISEPAIKLDLITPQKVLSAENFEVEVHYENISEMDFRDLEIELDLPKSFVIKESDPQPAKNNIWKIKELKKGVAGKSLVLKGNMRGPQDAFFTINAFLRASWEGQKYQINKKSADLSIASSPLSVSVALNGRQDYISQINDQLEYALIYRNNTDMGLNDVVITAQLTGEMFNFVSLETQGFFNSKDNTITWSAANAPGLRLLPPQGTGSVNFRINTRLSYPIKRLSDKNFVLKIKVEISSPTIPYYVAADKTIGITQFETKVRGQTLVDSQAFFKETLTDIVNKGALPPKVNIPTQYTIHWVITNYATDARNVKVSAFLQAGVKWTGQVKSNIDAMPIYNERTNEVVWLINRINATKGVISDPLTAIFQIEATPNVTQIAEPMPLLSKTTLEAVDEFTNLPLSDYDEALTTDLPDDITVANENKRVVP